MLPGINVVAQDCPPSQDILENYLFDAELLALREIHTNTYHEFFDSVWIPVELTNKYLGLLSSIDLLETELTRNIFDTYTIHVFPDVPYMEISMMVDTSLQWIKDFSKDSLISGNAQFDSIVSKYSFRLTSYYHFSTFSSMRIQSVNVLNLNPIVDSLNNISGLSNVSAKSSWAGDGDDIRITYSSDTSFVEFSKGWGDCPSGCDQRQYWKYSIIDCSSSFINTYGDIYTGDKEVSFLHLNIYPNPFDNYMRVHYDKPVTRINIFSITGKKIKTVIPDNAEINLSFLNQGVYMLEVVSGIDRKMVKVIKR